MNSSNPLTKVWFTPTRGASNWLWLSFLMPIEARSLPSRLVSTVTATTFVPTGAAAFASSSIARPPAAWTVRTAGVIGARAWIDFATVFGMSWSFRSRKIGRPSSASSSTP